MKSFILTLVFLITILSNVGLPKTDAQAVTEKVRKYRMAHEIEILQKLMEFLAIPNVASDSVNIRKNAQWLETELKKRGFKTQLLQTEGSPPDVYAELILDTTKPTVIFYAHFDGQPVVAEHWQSNPWQPILRSRSLKEGGEIVSLEHLHPPVDGELRVYARSASDDKSPIIALLTAFDALKASEIIPSVNIKFFFEGEEEAGSAHLPQIIQRYQMLLKGDVWLICDGPVHQTRKVQVYFGARGVMGLEMKVYGAIRGLHSGHYGNWAPNPAVLLSHLLSSMRDTKANILIKNYYDDVRPLTQAERRALQKIPAIESRLKEELGLAWTEGNDVSITERIMQPALNIRGLQAGAVGRRARNVIPTEAVASIDFRLVPNQTPDRVRQLVERHIKNQGFHIVYEEPDINTRRQYPKIIKLRWGKGYPPARTDMDLPVARAVVKVIEEALGTEIVELPTLGGSIPMYLFLDVLKTPVIGVPMVNHDNNQHAPNENLRVQNLWDGIEIYANLMARLGNFLNRSGNR